jgi:hypothetical protein
MDVDGSPLDVGLHYRPRDPANERLRIHITHQVRIIRALVLTGILFPFGQ